MMWRYRGACHTESVLCHCMYESQELYRRVYRVIVCMSRVPFHWFNCYAYLKLGNSASCQ